METKPGLRADIAASFGADVCEMEGAAIAHVCRIYGVPCAIVRSVSDNADGTSDQDFLTFSARAAELSSSVILQFLSGL